MVVELDSEKSVVRGEPSSGVEPCMEKKTFFVYRRLYGPVSRAEKICSKKGRLPSSIASTRD